MYKLTLTLLFPKKKEKKNYGNIPCENEMLERNASTSQMNTSETQLQSNLW